MAMPGVYAEPYELSRYTQTYTQANADYYYLRTLLRTISSSVTNRQPGTLEVPFLSQFDNDLTNLPPSQQFGMSTPRFQELLRQAWLRGTDSQMIFTFTASAQTAFAQVRAAQAVFDDLLGYGDFLTHGQPMNLAIPALGVTGPSWSGLKDGNQCLIRTFTDAASDGTVTITAFPGVTVTLPAPTTGATFIVNSNGTFSRVDGSATAPVTVQRADSPAVATAPATATNLTVTGSDATTASQTPTAAAQPSSQFWQDWEQRKQALVGKARHRASGTFSTTPVAG